MKPTNIIRTLRELIPTRNLTWTESERLAELQANKLRELLGISDAFLPEEAISTLPRIEVRRSFSLLVSGLTYWDSGVWVIELNATEPEGRMRFSLTHEFKHVLDHTTREWLYPDDQLVSSEEKAERLADYFAGALLMPKRHVKRLFGERRSLIDMADRFGVTERAMHVRLSQLGLIEPTPRCERPLRKRQRSVYRRGKVLERMSA